MFLIIILLIVLLIASVYSLGFLFYFLWSQYFNQPGARTVVSKKALVASFLSTISIFILIGYIAYIPFHKVMNQMTTTEKPFNKRAWDDNKYFRFQMSKDIIESKMCIAKDTSQIKEMLGDPSYKDRFKFRWHYNLGFPTKFQFYKKWDSFKHNNYLVLRLSLDSSKIASAEVITLPGPL